MSINPYLFVYGTLKRGFDNPFSSLLTEHAKFINEGYFKGEMYLCEWYPAALYYPKATSHVYGEIFKLNNPALHLPLLDEYEEVDTEESRSLYLRKTVPITLSDNSLIECQVYLFNQSVDKLIKIPSGVFLKKE